MRRARGYALVLCASLVLASVSHGARQTVDQVNGIGLIDYAARPKFEVGSWVRYHMLGSSETGESDDYTVTIVIAGEERFWGEDCFWVETWTEPKNAPPRVAASLMSYAIFTDSLPNLRSRYYMRKNIDATGPDGGIGEQLLRRPPSTLKRRDSYVDAPSVRLDTLGMDTTTVMGRTLTCRKVSWFEGKVATVDQRDSSLSTELRETRMLYLSPEIPVTGLARESLERAMRRKSWAIGRSQEGSPWNVMDIATGDAVVVEYGTGMKSQLLPEDRQVSLKQIDAAAKRRAPARKPGTPRKGS